MRENKIEAVPAAPAPVTAQAEDEAKTEAAPAEPKAGKKTGS